MKIARSGFEMRVTQQGLNYEQAHALLQQMCCKGVAQRMRMNRFRDAGLPGRLHTSLKNAIGSDGAIRLFAWKHPFGRTFPTPVRRKHLPERLSQHHLSVLAAFPAPN